MRGPMWMGTALLLLGCLAPARSQTPAEGTLSIGERQYKLSQALAYPVKRFDEARIAVLVSDRNLPLEKIRQALAKDGNDDDVFVTQPHVKLLFKPTGELESCQAWADNSSFSTSGTNLSGELKLDDDRAAGAAELARDGEGAFARSFQLRFDVPLGLAAPQPKPTRAGPVQPKVSGKFVGNGKAAKLAHVSARPGEPFDGQPSIELVLTEKDHSKDKNPRMKATFGDYGSALVISFHEDGSIFSCQVVHSAHKRKGFSSGGTLRMGEFELGDAFVAGQLTSDGEDEFFDDTWEVDLKFEAPLAGTPKKPAANPPKAANTPRNEPPAKAPAAPRPAADKLKVRALALPKTATDFEYKTRVEQLTFKSPAKVQALAAEVTRQLASQGWKTQGSDLVTPNSAILRRNRGEASLTIMLKPEGSGSKATVFAKGLDWAE